MYINSKITFLVNQDKTTIEVMDELSGITFLELTLSPAELSSALSRLSYTPVSKTRLRSLDKVGKKLQVSQFEFPLPDSITRYSDGYKDLLHKEAQRLVDEGWEVDNYFDRQDTFFTDANGEEMVRVTIRRWG